jgi:hypothetical protein
MKCSATYKASFNFSEVQDLKVIDKINSQGYNSSAVYNG